MSEIIPIYAIFSILALIAKVLILWFGRQELKSVNRWFLAFFISLFGVNMLELVAFYYPQQGDFTLLLQIYYACLLLMAFSFLALTLDLTSPDASHTQQVIKGALVMNIGAVLAPGVVIAGAEGVGFTFTRIAGPMYWLFQVSFLSTLILGVGILGYHASRNKELNTRRRAKALLISIMPIFMVALFVVVLMQMGIQITGSVLGSFAILLFLIVFTFTEQEHRLFKFLSYVPATEEYRLVNKLRDAFYRVNAGNMQAAINHFECVLIEDALNRAQGNKTAAANMLGVSRTTLRRKLENRATLDQAPQYSGAGES